MHRAGARAEPAGSSLIDALMTPAAFEHPAERLERMETHISWVILAGDYVYKIKKPVSFDFLDFHDLERRKFFCEEELRLNRHWAPEIYLDVVPVTNENGEARFGGTGEPVEYAVRMRRFSQDGLLDRQLERGLLTAADMRELGAHIAGRHEAAARVAADGRERFLRLNLKFIRDNFTALEDFADDDELQTIRDWTERELQDLEAEIERRFDTGFVRACHGDLHLANLVRLGDKITAFDCIEFNADLRQIDVMCDIAFLLMDLVAHRHHGLAAQFLNRYLERTGDYGGMTVFSLYFVYRCLVRAKVAAIRCQERSEEDARAPDRADVTHYVGMASRQIAPRRRVLVVTTGFSGSGKTWVSGRLLAALPAIRIRSDIERKRMFEMPELADSHSGVAEGVYSADAGARVYERMLGLAQTVLSSGHNVILDAAFLNRADRRAAIEVAQRCECIPVLLPVSAPRDILRERILKRAERADDPSEAGLAVLEHQFENAEPVTDDEGALVLPVDNVGDVDTAAITERIRDHVRG